jgi:hypothetical protein
MLHRAVVAPPGIAKRLSRRIDRGELADAVVDNREVGIFYRINL